MIKAWFSENLLLKLIALILTLVLHLVVNEDRDETEVFFVPVNTTMAADQVMMSDLVEKLSVSIRGKRSSLQSFREKALPVVEIDIKDANDGVFHFRPELIKMPPGLDIVSINPPTMKVEFDVLSKTFASVVVPPMMGELPQGYKMVSLTVQPSKVEAIGPSSRLDGTFALTEAIQIDGRTETLLKELRLRDVSARGVEFKPNKVQATVVIEPIKIERLFESLSIEVRDTRYDVRVEPPVVNVTLMGAPSELDSVEGQAITPVLDASDLDSKSTGSWKKKVEIDNLPPGIEVKSVSPAYVRLTTLEPTKATDPE